MKIFLDIGAWKGDTATSVLSSKHAFEKIYCFEPQEGLCPKIDPNVEVFEFGLWNRNCETDIYYDSEKPQNNDGESVYVDKFVNSLVKQKARMVRASDWFRDNLKTDDYVVMKLNCEGAECDILEDLMNSGEFDKVNALMVDFDVRKVPSQKHREAEIKELLKNYTIPMYFVGRYDQWKLRGLNFTHHWMDKIL
jgi:FkbM family methyltransferase